MANRIKLILILITVGILFSACSDNSEQLVETLVPTCICVAGCGRSADRCFLAGSARDVVT